MAMFAKLFATSFGFRARKWTGPYREPRIVGAKWRAPGAADL